MHGGLKLIAIVCVSEMSVAHQTPIIMVITKVRRLQRGHFQTDFNTLNIMMTFRRGVGP